MSLVSVTTPADIGGLSEQWGGDIARGKRDRETVTDLRRRRGGPSRRTSPEQTGGPTITGSRWWGLTDEDPHVVNNHDRGVVHHPSDELASLMEAER